MTQRDQGAKCHAVGTGEGFELGQSGFPSQDQGWGKVLSDETAQKELLGNPTVDRKPQSNPGKRQCNKRWYFAPGSRKSLKCFDDCNHTAGSGVMVNVNSLLLEKKN